MLNARQVLPLVFAAALAAAPLAAQTPTGSRYNLTQQKGSHNSEQRNETLPQALQFDPAKPYQAGCRNLELDLVQDSRIGATRPTRDPTGPARQAPHEPLSASYRIFRNISASVRAARSNA
jgi:hypothetical protein